MSMNITTNEISEIFAIMHDGVIDEFTSASDYSLMQIEVAYLARRINPEYTKFLLTLSDMNEVTFKTWPSILKSEPQIITDPNIIFSPKLHILDSSAENGLITVICNQASPDFDYCGGELTFRATEAYLTDQGGNDVPHDRLASICRDYWDEWSSKNKRLKRKST